MVLGIAGEEGVARKAKWCPFATNSNGMCRTIDSINPCSEGKVPKIGLLAVLTSTGNLNFYSVPRPASLRTSLGLAPHDGLYNVTPP